MVALCGLSIAPELHLAGPLSTFIPSYTSSFLPSVSKLTRLTEVSSKKYPQIFEKLQILAEPQQHSLDSPQTKTSWLFAKVAEAY